MAYPTKQKNQIGIEETHLQEQLSYWKQQLADAPPMLELPTDHPRQPVQTFRSARRSQELPQALTESLLALSQKEGVTLFMTLLTAFKTLLYRYIGQEDILVSSPITYRNSNKTEEPSNFFANILVLRTQLQGNPSFSELLGRVREMVREAYAHQDLPFEKLVEELQLERSLSYSPLFQVMFALHLAKQEKLEPPSPIVTPLQRENPTSKFDLFLSIEETDQGLLGLWEYNMDLFDAVTITQMAGHFQTLLERIVVHPELPISELPLLTEAERHQQLVKWNDTQTEYPQDKCIHQLFEEQVKLTPDAVALVYQNEQLTYRELNTRANQLAHHLQGLAVGPEVLVGICVERSLEMVVGLLGILKAGGAYVPLDATYPQERLAYMLSDSQVSVLLTQEKLVSDLPEHTAQVVCLDSQWGVISQESQENPLSVVQASNLAYVIYTSGSTGKPKGVLVAHQGLCNLAQAQISLFDVNSDSIVLQFASFSFDASIWEVVMALCSGARLCLGTKDSLLPGPNLMQSLRKYNITHVTLPPSALAVLPYEELLALRTIVVAGEACSPDLVAQWSKDRRFFNAYGPTESTVCSTVAECSDSSNQPSIGRPISNTQIYILDSHLQLVPIGVRGELYIGGAGLARGYLNRPKLTQEKFLVNPFSQQQGTRLYKTGDLARYLPNGNIEYLGRIDHQVKIRGFRIELGEIEAILSQHPSVKQILVIDREDLPGDKRLVAYIVHDQEQVPKVSELRCLLKEKLPDYMVPSAFVMLEAMPLTPNGKVNRKALPAPDTIRPDLEKPFVSPRTPVEEVLAGIWSEILRLKQIGVHDNFFHLGGHSLATTQILSRVREVFQIEIPFCIFFENPTIASLATTIEQDIRGNQQLRFPPIQPIPRNGNLPISFAQEGVCFIQQLAPESSAYQAQATIRLTGELNVNALQQSLSEMVRRHEIFRTTFLPVDGQLVQVIHPSLLIDLPLLDLCTLPENDRSTEVQRLLNAEFQKPFDPAQLPLVRWVLLRLSDLEHLLVHVEHHLVHDGWSFNVFLCELVELYRCFVVGKPSPLPELPIQFADFAHWQRQWMQGQEAEIQLAYWKTKLANSSPLLELPYDRPRPAEQTYRGATHRIELPTSLCKSLQALSRQEGTTLFMTMLTAFVTMLHRYTQQEDINVGSSIANRRLRETEGLIGMIVNTFVLRNDISGNPKFCELLNRVRQVTLEAYAHQDLPFGKVVEALQPTRNLSHNPLYQVMFSFHDAPLPDLEISGLNVSLQEALSNGSAKLDLDLVVIPRSQRSSFGKKAEGMTLVWEYNTDLFDATTIQRIIRHYQTLLESIVANPEQRISEMPLLTVSERHQLLGEWNDTQTQYPQDQCIHQLFEAQVEQTPNSVALMFEDQQLTYWELNCRANQLADYLQTLGVGPEVLVGLCVERSIEMVVAILAILKAGGAYVPLDPAYPIERLVYMLNDSQVSVLLTQQKLVNRLPEHQAQLVCLDTDSKRISTASQQNPISGVKPQHLAYVIYTSGSTGQPKGVMIQHQSLVNFSEAAKAEYQLCQSDRILQFASISFDAAAEEIYPCLSSGGMLVLRTDEMLSSVPHFLQKCQDLQLTVLDLPTAYWHLVVSELANTNLALPESLRLMIIGGERAISEQVAIWQEHVGSVPKLVNTYGPTEATVVTTLCQLSDSASAQLNGQKVPIGRPIRNAQLYVLDQYLQPVPIGVPGEMYIGGTVLARGYLNRPQLTQEKFIPDPFSNIEGARLYKTGDLVRYLPDGNIEYIDRIDKQVKIRGFRIELGEIEAVLSQYQKVKQAIVIAREDYAGDRRLIAYILPRQEQVPTIDELRCFLKQKLPAYMMPNAFALLESLPLTPNGKIDYRALPTPNQLKPEQGRNFVPPRTLVEQHLVDIWNQVLKVEVGIHDNFFELGGHSLLATQVFSRLRQAFSVELPLHSLFKFPTVAELAEYLETLRWITLAQQTPAFTTKDIREQGEI